MSPSRHTEEEYVSLNLGQHEELIGPYGILETADEGTMSSQFYNPTFEPLAIVESFKNLALQQKQEHRQNKQFFHLVVRLAEKFDDLKATRVAASDYEREENRSPSCVG